MFPLSPKTKRPLRRGYRDNLIAEIDDLIDCIKDFPSSPLGMVPAVGGLVVVDVDNRHDGLKRWKDLIKKHGEPLTLKQVTPSGGVHYIFRAEEEVSYKGKIIKGIDVQHNKYIRIQSPHTSGDLYEFTNLMDFNNYDSIPSPPKWLKELIEKPERKKTDRITPILEKAEHEPLSKALDKLARQFQDVELDYDEWIRCGMAIKSCIPNGVGLNLFLKLSNNLSLGEDDFDAAEYKWNGFSSRKDSQISLRTLFYIARRKGLDPSISENEYKKIIDKAEFDLGWAEDEGRFVTFSKDFLVRDLNSMGYCFIESHSIAPFAQLKNENGKQTPFFSTFSFTNFKDKTSPYFLGMISGSKQKYLPAAAIWKAHKDRQTYSEVTFQDIGSEPPGTLNLYQGLNIERNQGDCNELLDFVFNSLCSTKSDSYEFLLNFLAHIIQKPFEKTPLVPVFVGPQGTGKGLLNEIIMSQLLGDYFLIISSISLLQKNFNSHLKCRFLTFIDEGDWRGDKRDMDILKHFTGSSRMLCEEKGGATYNFPNYSRYIIASNNSAPVGLEIGDRRFCFIENSGKYANNTSYFSKLIASIEKNNLIAKFANFLFERDISKFNHNQALSSHGVALDAKLNSVGPVAHFWHDLFFEQPREVYLEGIGIHCNQTLLEYHSFEQKHFKNKGQEPSRNFWDKTKKLMPVLPKRSESRIFNDRSRVRKISISELLSSFCSTLKIDKPEAFSPSEYAIKREFTAIDTEDTSNFDSVTMEDF